MERALDGTNRTEIFSQLLKWQKKGDISNPSNCKEAFDRLVVNISYKLMHSHSQFLFIYRIQKQMSKLCTCSNDDDLVILKIGCIRRTDCRMIWNFRNILFFAAGWELLLMTPPSNCAIGRIDHTAFRFQIKKKTFTLRWRKNESADCRINQMCIG